MKAILRCLILAVIPFFASLAQSTVQGISDSTGTATLEGLVIDSLHQRVAGAEIYSLDGPFKATSDTVGVFRISGIPAGTSRFAARKPGYGPAEFEFTVRSGETKRVAIVLLRVENVLAPVVVEESQVHRALRDVGFYERAGNSRGTFLSPEILATRRSGRASDFLKGVNGVYIKFGRGGTGGLPYGTGGFMKIGSAGVCLMNLYIDGSRVEIGTASDRGLSRGSSEEDNTTLDDVISANDVGAIEVYPSGVTGPPKYSGVSRGCGTILIWTKVKLDTPPDGERN